MKAHGRTELQLHSFLLSALDGVNGLLHAPATLPPEKNPSNHRIEDWVGSKAGLEGFWIKHKCLAYGRVQTPGRKEQHLCTLCGWNGAKNLKMRERKKN
jgi:hypothetical protein